MEAYSGHGRITVGEGPIPYGVQTVPEPAPTQVVIGETTFGIWREDIYQLAIDFSTLFELRGRLDQKLLRTSQIDEGLMQATLLFDPELPELEMLASARAARDRLKPLLEAVNGSTMPTLHAFGHAHIDVAWLWPWQETERKMARTVVNQLVLFDEYPEFKFLQSQPHLFVMLRQKYPELYQRLVKAVKDGNFIIDGAMWVEGDTNLAGGEALIRQVIYGRRFFKEEFGVDSRVLWLPDVFGYSGALPQILKGCGCVGFATQKITWAYNGGEPFPYNTFWWEGIDGSAIPAHIYTDYNSQTRPNAVMDRWESRLQPNGINSLIMAFGWGDGGGGPERNHLEFMRRAQDLEGLPRLKPSSPAEFFADLEKQGLPKERYVGELYFQAHRGTYTSQAKTKQGNRQGELALREAEFWGTAARFLNQFSFTPKSLYETWQTLLLCQFHDVLPGSSIQRVYIEAEAALGEVIAKARHVAHEAAETFVDTPPLVPASGGAQSMGQSSALTPSAVTLFNSLNWPRAHLMETPSGMHEVIIPSCGYSTFSQATAQAIPNKPVTLQKTSPAQFQLENEFLVVQLNTRGELASVFDKQAGREVMAGPGGQFRLYKDVPDNWDAWDLDSMYELQPVLTEEPVTLEVLTNDPLVVKIKLTRKLSHSTLTQVISLRRGSRRIEFANTLDWQESHKLLKVAFPLNLHANEAIHEIQFGHLKRPNHRSRQFDADRFEVSNHRWTALAEENRGAAVLNDCKYGVNVLGNTIQLTLLKSPMAPDMVADKGLQTFTYALYPWTGSFSESNVVREAYELNVPVMVLPGVAGEGSLFSLRWRAPMRRTSSLTPSSRPRTARTTWCCACTRASARPPPLALKLGIPATQAWQTDMMEENGVSLPIQQGVIALDFRPFEIKTLRLK